MVVGVDHVAVAVPAIVDENVEVRLFARDDRECVVHLSCVVVIAANGDAAAAGGGHRVGRLADRPGEVRAAIALVEASPGDVNGRAGRAEGNRHTLADSAASPGDDGDLACQWLHR